MKIEKRKHKILGQYKKSLKILGESAAITKNVTSYVVRHSFVMCLREKDVRLT
jgi:site-specific recombinase XerD